MKDHPIKQEIDRAIAKFEKRKYRSPDVDKIINNFIWSVSGFCLAFPIALLFVKC